MNKKDFERISDLLKELDEQIEQERMLNFGKQAVKIIIGSEDEQEEL